MEKNKQELFELLDNLYDIMADAIKPRDKDKWKNETWENLRNTSEEYYNDWVETTKAIILLQSVEESTPKVKALIEILNEFNTCTDEQKAQFIEELEQANLENVADVFREIAKGGNE